MSMKKEDYDEFQRQLQLQKDQQEEEMKKLTKKDDDGTEYEWDEAKKAWFPKLSVDLMMQFQSNYQSDSSENTTYLDPQTNIKYSWDVTEKRWKPETYQYVDSKSGASYTWDEKSKSWKNDSNVEGSSANPQNFDDCVKNEDGNVIYTNPQDGVKYKWDETLKVWINDDGKVLYPQQTGNEGTADGKQKKKNQKKPAVKRAATKPEWFAVDEKKNTSVYVSGLPPDISQSEYAEMMSKCGIIGTNPLTGGLKLKLYSDKEGNLKGDGLCCYLKKESIELAKQLLDGSDIRGYKLQVEEASFQMKGSFDPSKKPKMLSKKEKQKVQKNLDKRLDWKLNRTEEAVSKSDRVVILKNMFETKEFEVDPVLIAEIREDLRNECEKFGAVKKVIVFDRHPDGVCSVAFKEIEDAKKCQTALNGRWFAQKTVQAEIWDGTTNYQIEETDKEREVRLKKWEEYLEGKDGDSKEEEDNKTQ